MANDVLCQDTLRACSKTLAVALLVMVLVVWLRLFGIAVVDGGPMAVQRHDVLKGRQRRLEVVS